MKIYLLFGTYHNQPYGLHFEAPGEYELDAPKIEFLLRDAPNQFSRTSPVEVAALKAPAHDKMVRAPRAKKEEAKEEAADG